MCKDNGVLKMVKDIVEDILDKSGVIVSTSHIKMEPTDEDIDIVGDVVCVNTGRVGKPQKMAQTINLLIKYFDEKGFYMRDIMVNSHEQQVDATIIFERNVESTRERKKPWVVRP